MSLLFSWVSILQLYRWNEELKKEVKPQIESFNTSIVSVELNLYNLLLQSLSWFQYFNCIGGIFDKRAQEAAKYELFQYFNCIGGIPSELVKVGLFRMFQYFNCIGGILLRRNYIIMHFSFNTSIVSVEYSREAD